MGERIMKIGVKVMPKKEVLDSQGRAVERTLRQNSKPFAEKLQHCRVGKYIVLDIGESDKTKAMARATEICEFVLYNPLTETYELEVIS
jgi:phosphoribosylformylglycinamidine synthase subunit PurS